MRKRPLALLLALTLLCSLFVPTVSAAKNDNLDALTGVYEGYYFATQGQTGVTLTVTGDTAKFEFYNLPGKSNSKNGSYWMSVSEDNGVYSLVGTEWIDHPSTYSFVDLEGTLSGKVFSGKVIYSSGILEFYMERPTDAYSQLQQSVFGDHRYAYVDEKMTWEQAKDYCAEQGGYLATITSQEEADFVAGLLDDTDIRPGCWLGGVGDGNDWLWDNGEPWSYGTPPVHSGNLMTSAAGSWRGEDGNVKAGFLCEWGAWSDASNWSNSELQRASDQGLIPDVLIGKDMTQKITRGEFSAVVVKLYEAMTGGRAIIAANCPLTDIDEDMNRLYILKAYNLNLVNGIGNDLFAPGDSLTREQMATMLCRVYKLYQNPMWTLKDDDTPLDISGVARFADHDEISDFALESVYFMSKAGVIQGIDGNRFAPKNTTTQQEAIGYANATREQAIVLSLRTLEHLK